VSEFLDLPLHDAVVSTVLVHWADRRVEFSLSVFVEAGTDAKPYRLCFNGVSNLAVPHASPWGESASINAVRAEAGQFELEMQSGDVITIVARGFSFAPHAL
jgi:hypothetical protein